MRSRSRWRRCCGTARSRATRSSPPTGMSYDELLALGGRLPAQALPRRARASCRRDSFNVLHVPPSADEIAANKLDPGRRSPSSAAAIPAMLKLAMATPLDTWKTWMTVRLLSGGADLLPERHRRRQFRLLRQVSAGPREAARPLAARRSPRSRAISARRSARSMSTATSRRRARRRWRSWSATCAWRWRENLKDAASG